MNKILFTLMLITSMGINLNAQTFTLSDTTLQAGDSLVKHFPWGFHQELPEQFKEPVDSIVRFLIDNPTLKIEISNHTDARGSNDYNLEFSKNIAKSIANYISINGVAEERITSKGYGKESLIYSDEEIHKLETEEERENLHAKNRRTVFKIIAL